VEHFSYLPAGAPGRIFVRRAARGGALGSLLGGLYASADRPLRELRASAAARRAGVSVPEPLAVRSTRVRGPWRRFTVVTREVPDAADLLSLAPGLSPSRKRVLIHRVADEMRRLHDAGIYHADLTMKNILLSGEDVFIIDLDKATMTASPDERLAVRNLARLNRSVVKLFGGKGNVTRTDKLRFLRRYLGGSERVREMAAVCGSGLWVHRLWWALSGQA
jgi:tRNA A-37 threonylcarbamoyl transferase component Bud32